MIATVRSTPGVKHANDAPIKVRKARGGSGTD